MQRSAQSGSGPGPQPAYAAPTASVPLARTGLPASAATPTTAPAARALPGFVWRVRVYYEDTDAGGVVYYANYLRYLERCRTEWMRALGFGQRELAERDGVLFVVAGAEMQFLRSAVLDDELIVDASISERHASYVVFEQQARRGSELLCRARVKVACIGARSLRPTRLPAALAMLLAGAAQVLPCAPGGPTEKNSA